MLQKGLCSFEYMDDWTKFKETLLYEEEDFYTRLNMEYITDADYTYAKRVFKDCKIKNLGEYHDLYVPNNTLFVANLFENFRNMS